MSKPEYWKCLQEQAEALKKVHLRDLLKDEERNNQLLTKFNDIVFDFSHQKIDTDTLSYFFKLQADAGLRLHINDLFNGKHINSTEDRSVLHTCLRAPIDSPIHPIVLQKTLKDVHHVLNRIQSFSQKVREGESKGATGKLLKNLIVIGIGGSYLSIQFVYEALRSHPAYAEAIQGRKIRFLANVDPIDFNRAVDGLDVEETLILINSKTFTTAETILNAKSCRKWLIEEYQKKGHNSVQQIVKSHMCACSTNLKQTSKFGIAEENVFGFWDFVGGRFSVWSAIGILPLSIHFGYDVMDQFLKGGHAIDRHFVEQKSTRNNIPLLLGILGFYRTSILNYSARAIVPYCQALSKFAPHIQQLDMESNGKRTNLKGQILEYQTAVVNFGQPGTNGQHSFFQLLHQGRTIPVQFIGYTKSQTPVKLEGELVSNHDELMSNFFSQPDALALGKSIETLKMQNTPEQLLYHKQFPGDRPSCSLLFTRELNAFNCGELLALYEHRTSVEGFLWDVNSYDQWGVELGKVLAKKVRQMFHDGQVTQQLNSATRNLAQIYLDNRGQN